MRHWLPGHPHEILVMEATEVSVDSTDNAELRRGADMGNIPVKLAETEGGGESAKNSDSSFRDGQGASKNVRFDAGLRILCLDQRNSIRPDGKKGDLGPA